jgi:hypothetical protein
MSEGLEQSLRLHGLVAVGKKEVESIIIKTFHKSKKIKKRRFIMPLKKMFQDVQEDLKKNLESVKKDRLPGSSKPVNYNGSGKIEIPFELDGDGNYHFETEQYGAGVTLHCTAWIEYPDATYSVTVTSSDGGGGHWDDLQPGQKVTCDIKTSLWHKTKVTVDIHANVTNVDGKAMLEYTY